jgi:farnesyl diphosphate synthase
MDNYLSRIEQFLDNLLSKNPFDTYNTRLLDAVRYSVLKGGKRIRPILVYSVGEAFKTPLELLDAPAAAIELIHCYSLIHDDLPAMDNDDLRRGKPTCHKAFDEATAILAGDALQSLAFELLSEHERQQNLFTAHQQLQMVNILAKASGMNGMVLGQTLDMHFDHNQQKSQNSKSPKHSKDPLSLLTRLHKKKTGALIEAAVALGGIASHCENPKILSLLQNYAENLGLAFQIQDDILDVEGQVENLGKNPGQDAALNKQTFTSLLGLDEAKSYMLQHYQAALSHIKTLGDDYGLEHNPLLELTTFLFQRQY